MNIFNGSRRRILADLVGEWLQLIAAFVVYAAFGLFLIGGALWLGIIALRLVVDIVLAPFGLAAPF